LLDELIQGELEDVGDELALRVGVVVVQTGRG
jgi:hypothetical protein